MEQAGVTKSYLQTVSPAELNHLPGTGRVAVCTFANDPCIALAVRVSLTAATVKPKLVRRDGNWVRWLAHTLGLHDNIGLAAGITNTVRL